MSLNPEVNSAYITILKLVRRDHPDYSPRKQRRMAQKLTQRFLKEVWEGKRNGTNKRGSKDAPADPA